MESIIEKIIIIMLSAFAGIGWFCMMQKSGAFIEDVPIVTCASDHVKK